MRPLFVSVSLVVALLMSASATVARATPIGVEDALGAASFAAVIDATAWDAADPGIPSETTGSQAGVIITLPPEIPADSTPPRPESASGAVHSVPEPGTLLLLATGVGVLGARTLRTRRHS